MTEAHERGQGEARVIRIIHLFPELLSAYGDSGNVRTLVVRAEARGIEVCRGVLLADASAVPPADLFLIGGGQDRDQVRVARSLLRLGDGLSRQIGDGAALLAVCGGYQSLGTSYRNGSGATVHGPAILGVTTIARAGRLVGPVVARLVDPAMRVERDTIVGFENHSGRTELGPQSLPLARVVTGHGNNDRDGMEGVLERPGARGLRGLRIGTYLHGPFLPRNPHVADMLLRAALERTGQPTDLTALDDAIEWRAHDLHVARFGRRAGRLPDGLRRLVEPVHSLIGF